MQWRVGITVGLAVLLAACGGGGGADTAISGGVVKGPVLGATVCAFALTGGAKGARLPVRVYGGVGSGSGTVANGCFVTAADGAYHFLLPDGTQGEVLLEATGGRFCSNEVPVASGACAGGGTLVDLGASVMKAVTAAIDGETSTVYTSPLTTAAVEAAGANLTAARFASRFIAIARQILGAGTSVTPTTPPTPTTHPYLASLATYLAGGGSLATAVDRLESGSTDFQGGGSTAPAAVHASLVGTHELVFRAGSGAGCGTRCSYTEGQAVTITVHADGRLSIPGKVLANPFHRVFGASGPHLPEIIWLDADNDIEYALSDNSEGTFNEINVGDARRAGPSGVPGFIGQLRKQLGGDAAMQKLRSLAGSYTIGYQYRGADVPWTGVTIAADGSIDFTGGAGPDVPASTITEVVDRMSCCGRLDVQTSVDVDGDGTAQGNQVSLYLDAGGALRSVEYQFGVTISVDDDVGVRLGSVPALVHTGRAIPAEPGIYGTVNGTAMNFSPLSFADASLNGFSLEASSGTGIAPTWLLQVSAPVERGATYDCRVSPGNSVRMNVRTTTNGNLRQSSNGGRCAITVTHLVVAGGNVTELAGTFTAEIFDFRQDTAPLVVTNGVFRYIRP